MERLSALQKQIAIRDARSSLLSFIQANKPDYGVDDFHRKLCLLMQDFYADVLAKKSPRYIIISPPQMGKSEIMSRSFPAWALGKSPWLYFIAGAYASDWATSLSADVQNIMMREEYHEIFPEAIVPRADFSDSQGSQRADFFELVGKPGRYRAAGRAKGVTGRPAHIILIDDPLKDQFEANSDAIREQCWGWWNPTLRTRLQDGGGVMLTLTRWHLDDMAGRMIDLAGKDPDADQWKVVVFPALLGEEDCEACRKRKGVQYLAEHTCRSLAPHRFRHETLIRTRATSSPAVWNALYRGTPVSLAGNILPASAWRYYGGLGQVMLPDLRQFDFIVQSWDGSFKDTTSADFCAGQVWGVRGSEVWLLDYILEQMSFTRFVTAIRQMSYKWPASSWIFIEDKANGTAAMDVLSSEISGVSAVEPKGGKVARAWASSSRLCGGNCFLPDASIAPWVKGFVDRCNVFPANINKAGSDDDIDAFTQMENEVKNRTLGVHEFVKAQQEAQNDRIQAAHKVGGEALEKITASMPDGRKIELNAEGTAWVYCDSGLPVVVEEGSVAAD
jgi:predicted phage terminase large subunit-like protein